MAYLQNDKETDFLRKDDQAKKRTRRLSQALVVSILLNVTLFFFCAYESQEMGYFLLRKSHYKPSVPLNLSFSYKTQTLEEGLRAFSEKSTPELFALLEDEMLVVDGYKARDLALGLLSSTRHFNLEKALPGNLAPQQARIIPLLDEVKVKLFPGLSQEQRAALLQYVKEERYPYTPEGLFCELKLSPQEVGLKEAFSHTQEYLIIEAFLSRAGNISRDDVLDLLVAGDWKRLTEFTESEDKAQDFSPERRQKFLLSYLACPSKKAAELLVTFDRDFTLHNLDDDEVITLLSLLENAPTLSQDFALALLESERSDAVWKAAQTELAKLAKQEELIAFSRSELLAHFGRKVPTIEKAVAQTSTTPKKSESKPSQTPKAQTKLATSTPKPKIEPKPQPKKPILSSSKPTQNKPSPAPSQTGHATKPPQPKATAKVTPKQQASKKPVRQIIYVVQNGDNLWRIAKKFQVDIAVIRKANNLKSDAVKPGLALRIPN